MIAVSPSDMLSPVSLSSGIMRGNTTVFGACTAFRRHAPRASYEQRFGGPNRHFRHAPGRYHLLARAMGQVVITAIRNPSFALAILLPCRTMDVEWDEQRRHTNIAKHGVEFVAAASVFDGPILEVEDRRRDYGEMRFQALGNVAAQVIHVVYTWRGRRRRIISARRASRDERQRYYAGIQRSAGRDDR
jgi:uncharacterized DUF497 family protein